MPSGATFVERDEIGAACAVYRDGHKVVDLWGGYRDGSTRAPWREDTVVVMYSTTKGVSSLALALAHSRGLLDFDQRVAAYWPEFGVRGKQDITVRQLLSHQAGLPVIDIPLTVDDLHDLDVVAAAIALQRPLWTPGTRHGYHAISLGWYEGELLRRVDPARRSLGRFFTEEITAPLGIEFHIGLPPEFDPNRRATIHGRGRFELLRHLGDLPWGMARAMLTPGSLTLQVFTNPPELLVDTNCNRIDLLTAELPAATGIGQPRAVAAAYGAAVTGKLGLTGHTLAALTQPAQPPIDDRPRPAGARRVLVGLLQTRPRMAVRQLGQCRVRHPRQRRLVRFRRPRHRNQLLLRTQPARLRARRPPRNHPTRTRSTGACSASAPSGR